MISNAEHFIYIENQFFISKSAGSDVHNQISEALIQRIKQAEEKKEKFRVIIILPLLPGFEGEIDGSSASILKVQMHWQYATICRGGASIIETLQSEFRIDPDEYISFLSLRQHGKIGANPVTELIYIHSKVQQLKFLSDQDSADS